MSAVAVTASIMLFAAAGRGQSSGRIADASLLSDLAVAAFGELTVAESLLLTSAVSGESVVVPEEFRNGVPRNWSDWDERSVIRSNVLEWLLNDLQASSLIHFRGIHVVGALFDDALHLRSVATAFPLIFELCSIPGGVDISWAQLEMLSLIGSYVGAVYAAGASVNGDLDLSNGFECPGGIWLTNARIRGNLYLDEAKLQQQSFSYALCADALELGGALFLRSAVVEGSVKIHGATIGGTVELNGSTLRNSGGVTLAVSRCAIGGDVFLIEGFSSTGRINLVGTHVRGNLTCSEASLSADGMVLEAERTVIDGHTSFVDTAVDGFLSLSYSTTGGVLELQRLSLADSAVVFLERADADLLSDDQSVWMGTYVIEGFTYRGIHNLSPLDTEARIAWIRGSYRTAFNPQPYVCLASVLQSDGKSKDANRVLIAKNQDPLLRESQTWAVRTWQWLLWVFVGYGYVPQRAVYWAVTVVLIGTVLSQVGFRRGVLVSRSDSRAAPRFSAILFSLDVFVPLLDLRQAAHYLPVVSRASVLLQWWLAIEAVLGWLITSLLVGALVGLLQA